MILTLSTIAYQDIRDRLVWWFLYLVLGAVGAYFFIENSPLEVYSYFVLINLSIVGFLLVILFTYVKVTAKKQRFRDVFGLGEVFLLIALALSFPTLSFLVLLFFSLIFSIMVHLILFKSIKKITVPAAGYISLFLIGAYIINWLVFYNDLYLL